MAWLHTAFVFLLGSHALIMIASATVQPSQGVPAVVEGHTTGPGGIPYEAVTGESSTISVAALGQEEQESFHDSSRPKLRPARIIGQGRNTAGVASAGQDLILQDSAGLPCVKPPMWSNPRTLATGGKWSIVVDADTNVTRIVIKHNPIEAVTPQMLVWLWNNLDRTVPHPYQRSLYQIHVLRHPGDNAFFRYSFPRNGHRNIVYNVTDPSSGTPQRFGVFYSAGCVYSATADGPVVSCPSRRVVPTCRTPSSEVIAQPSINTTTYPAYIAYNNKTGCEGVVYAGAFPMYKETLRWSQVGRAVVVQETVVFGIDEKFAAQINRGAIKAITGLQTNGDMDEFFARLVQHEMESYGWLSQWLPAIWQRYAKRR